MTLTKKQKPEKEPEQMALKRKDQRGIGDLKDDPNYRGSLIDRFVTL